MKKTDPGGSGPPSPPARGGWRADLLACGAVLLLGLLAYSHSFHGEFVFDDLLSISESDLVAELSRNLLDWSAYRAQPNRYVGNLTFALNHRIGGLEVTGYHVVNLAIHLLNALLIYALVRLSFRTPFLLRSELASSSRAIALVAALLFVAHPIETQAVTYVVQRFASLATTFYLLTVALYARWRLARVSEGGGILRSAVGLAPILAAAFLAMKTKEIAFTLPIAVFLFEFSFFEASWRRRLLLLAPVLVTLAVVPLTLLSFNKPISQALSDVTEVTRVQTAMPRLDYLRTQLPVIGTYLRLLVLPVGQNLDYDYPVYRSFLEPRVALSLLVILALLAVGAFLYVGRTFRRPHRALDPATRFVAFGIAWFFLALSVESSVIPIVDVIFEHRVYLPSTGLFAAAATALALLARRYAPARPAAVTLAVGSILALVLGVATFRRNEVWATELSVWTDVVKKSPGKARPQSNLGMALAKAGRLQEALPHLQEARRLDPVYVPALNNLGVVLAQLGREQEATALLRRSLQLQPSQAEAHYNLGRILIMREDGLGEAARMFQRTIEFRRYFPDAYANLAAAWNGLGRHADTVKLLEDARVIVRDQPQAHYNLGAAYLLLGNRQAAEREVLVLRRLSPEMAGDLERRIARGVPGRR